MKKVLIIGSTGMAGHVIYSYLNSLNKYKLSNMAYRKKINDSTIILDVTDSYLLSNKLVEISPDVIINCVGLLIKGSTSNKANAIYLNSYLPHQLAQLAEKINSKLIHISTDCVFSGEKGNYLENDFRDANDIYGRSKSLGEVDYGNHLTLRTSIIGPELKEEGEGLMHWLFKQKGEINGYDKAIWSGVTTLELARFINDFIELDIAGIYHLTSKSPISKFELLQLIKSIWKIKFIKINKVDGKFSNKSLVDSRNLLQSSVQSYNSQLQDLFYFMKRSMSLYQHYVNL